MNRSLLALVLTLASSSVAFAGPPRKLGTEHEHTTRRAPARSHRGQSSGHDDRFTKVQLGLRSERFGEAGPVTVFVNGDGARLTPGFEDAANNRSSIVSSSGTASVDIPAFAGGAARWGQVMTCVEQQFADFDVTITDQRPDGSDYIMLMVGGTPDLIGEGDGVAGIAPFNGGVITGAVGFAFSGILGNDTRETCETVAHEIGHTLGLDHTHECTDTMSYLFGCGDKWFRDLEMSCGEWDPRSCSGGAATQNSHAQLAAAVGLRSGGDGGFVPADGPVEPEVLPPTDPWIDWEQPVDDHHAHGPDWDPSGRWEESAQDGDIEWVEPDDWDGWIGGEWVWVEWVEWVDWDGSSGCGG